MDFTYALNALREGKKVSRSGWNGKGMWIALSTPRYDGGDPGVIQIYPTMTLPYIFMSTVQDDLVPWLASQTDLLADDWGIAEWVSAPE